MDKGLEWDESAQGDWAFTTKLSEVLQNTGVPREMLAEEYMNRILDSARALAVLNGVEETCHLMNVVEKALIESDEYYSNLHESLETLVEIKAL